MNAAYTDIPLVVMCGGRGTRLQPATHSVPKALVPVNGRPIIDYVVDFFAEAGIRNCHLCIGYKGNLIREHFHNRPSPLSISFTDSGEDAGILKRLHELRDCDTDRFIVAYCDTFIDIDVRNLYDFHMRSGSSVTLVTAPIQSPFGLVGNGENGRVVSFVEKPVQDYFIGCFIVERRALAELPRDIVDMPDGSGIVEMFRRMVEAGEVAAYRHDGLNITFNTDSERARAEKVLDAFYTLREPVPKQGD